MKIGCHASALQPVRKAPYDEAIRNAGKIGFAGVELIAMDRGELYDYYTPPRVKELRALAAANGLEISQFAVYSTACEGMASLDAAEKSDGMKVFEKGIDVCADLGCKIVNLVSHWPVGLKAPIEYPPSYIYPIARGAGRMPTSKVVMEIPQPFDFARIWDNYVDSLSKATSYAAKRGVKLAIEGHAHVIVSGADALLRLFDRLDHPNAVVNFDTSWHFIQREYVPMAIHKLKGKIAHVHMGDRKDRPCAHARRRRRPVLRGTGRPRRNRLAWRHPGAEGHRFRRVPVFRVLGFRGLRRRGIRVESIYRACRPRRSLGSKSLTFSSPAEPKTAGHP